MLPASDLSPTTQEGCLLPSMPFPFAREHVIALSCQYLWLLMVTSQYSISVLSDTYLLWWTWVTWSEFKMLDKFYFDSFLCSTVNITIFSNGCLGSHTDEERSEMRYVMRIAKPRESSKLWTHIALLCLSLQHTFLSVFEPNSALCLWMQWTGF